MTRIAASAGVCTSPPMKEWLSRAVETDDEMSSPPRTVPRMMEKTVRPSIQLLPLTSMDGGSISVTMPYLAGE
ncbi:hypothetical protein D3C85_1615100 [compost metagenome]